MRKSPQRPGRRNEGSRGSQSRDRQSERAGSGHRHGGRNRSGQSEWQERGSNRERGTGQDRTARRQRPSTQEIKPKQERSEFAGADPDKHTEETALLKGRHPVTIALEEGRPINKVLIAEGAAEFGITPIVAKAREQGIVVQYVPRAKLDAVAGSTHQGVAAYVAPYSYVEVEDIVARETGQAPLIVVLDGVTDPYNLGAIVRTAEAAGAQGIVIGKHRAAPVTETVAKASAGALEFLPIARVSNISKTLEDLKEQGYWVVGTDVDAENRMVDVDYKHKTVLVIGSEGEGMHRLVKERCDFLVSIPILGRVQSLNASVAAGVMLYEVVRQRT